MRLNFSLNHSILTILDQWFFHILSQAFGSTGPSKFLRAKSNFVKSFRKIVTTVLFYVNISINMYNLN